MQRVQSNHTKITILCKPYLSLLWPLILIIVMYAVPTLVFGEHCPCGASDSAGNTQGSNTQGSAAQGNQNSNSTYTTEQDVSEAITSGLNALDEGGWQTSSTFGNDGWGFSSTETDQPEGNESGGGGSKSSCTSAPNIVIEDIFFVAPGAMITSNSAVNQNRLYQGQSYDPILQIRNVNCGATNFEKVTSSGTTTYHQDLPPFGQNGSFPVRARIDFNQNGSYETQAYFNSVGPLAGGQGLYLRLSTVTMDELGTHDINSTVDLKDSEDSGKGCLAAPSGDWGCISEQGSPTSNDRAETFTVITPSITLGSYIITDVRTMEWDNGASRVTYTIATPNTNSIRSITTGQQVGLYWSGTDVRMNTCSGQTTRSSGGTLTDFSGQQDIQTGFIHGTQGLPSPTAQNDARTTEPVADTYHEYTITCQTEGGTIVSDSVIITNGADISNIVIVNPILDNRSVSTNSTLTSIPFRSTNDHIDPVLTYDYEFRIDGALVGAGTYTGIHEPGVTITIPATINYSAPSAPGTLPMEVCLSHPNMSSDSCANATLTIVAPQCSDFIDNDGDGTIDYPTDIGCTDALDNDEGNNPLPTIDANPTLVRQGDTVVVSWNPNGNVGCTLSNSVIAIGGASPVVGSGSATDVPQGQTTYSIICPNGQSDTVTVKVLSQIEET